MYVCALAAQAARGEIAKAATGVQDYLAARPYQTDFPVCIHPGRDARTREHFDAVDFEGRCSPLSRDQFNQGIRVPRDRLEAGGHPVINGSLLTYIEKWISLTIKGPLRGVQQNSCCGTPKIKRTVDRGLTRTPGREQRVVHGRRQQRSYRNPHDNRVAGGVLKAKPA